MAVQLGQGIGPADMQLLHAPGVITIAVPDGSTLSMSDGNTLSVRFFDGTIFGSMQIEAMLRTPDRTTATDEADLLFGTTGADTISALAGDDVVYAGDGADVIDGGAGADVLFGGEGADSLTGGIGNDTLAGGLGADIYRFGKGFGQDVVDDTYLSASTNAADDGAVDAVEFDASIAPAEIAVYQRVSGTTISALLLSLSSTGDSVTLEHAYAAGNAGAVELVRFSDGTQWDLATLKTKVAGQMGYDTNDTLLAPVVGSRMEGRGGNDSITGSSGADILDGGTGNDTMTGLAGDDTYWVDSLADVVVEATGGGIDTVMSSVNGYVLAAQVERLQLVAGTQPLNATGNALANTMIGNAGNNRLDGGAGIDTMLGGAGDDTYVVDSTSDVVTELFDEGIDTVESTVTIAALAANVENLKLMGTSKISGTGNALDNLLVGNSAANTLTGNAGNDTLDGGAGTDTLIGGAGDDMYVINVTADVVIEALNGGLDTVNVSLAGAGTYLLAANVENAFVGNGVAGVNLTGNSLANVLTGNAAANTLIGGAGADTLVGGGGTDTLTGGTEADWFVFDFAPGAGNVATITDFQTGVDTIGLKASVFSALGLAGARIGLSDKLLYNSSTGALSYDADGVGGNAAVVILILGTSTHPATLGADFFLI